MNGVGRKGLKFVSVLLMILLAYLIAGGIFIAVFSKKDGYGIGSFVIPGIIGSVIGIIINVVTINRLNNYTVGRGSPLNFVSLVMLCANSVPLYFLYSNIFNLHYTLSNLTQYGYDIYLFLFIACIVLFILLTIGNLLKKRVIIFIGDILSTATYSAFIVWYIKILKDGSSEMFDMMYSVVSYPIIFGSIFCSFVLAITSFVMIFSVFFKSKKVKEMEVGNLMSIAFSLKCHEKGYINDEELHTILKDYTKKEVKQAKFAMRSPDVQEELEKMTSNPDFVRGFKNINSQSNQSLSDVDNRFEEAPVAPSKPLSKEEQINDILNRNLIG